METIRTRILLLVALFSFCWAQPPQIRVCSKARTGADYLRVNYFDSDRFHQYAPGCTSELGVCFDSINPDKRHRDGKWEFGFVKVQLDLTHIGTLVGIMPGVSVRSFTPDGTILLGPDQGGELSLWDIQSRGWDGFSVRIQYSPYLLGPLSIPVSCTIRYLKPVYDSNGIFTRYEMKEAEYTCGTIHVPQQVPR